ncbi:MAG: methyltransferase domain-containing protein, partial [Planctomycetaceae bacterium]|nr:methyltransferase domain-containing protein [Planctomycetaceae bacterium]
MPAAPSPRPVARPPKDEHRSALRKLIEFKGIGRLSLSQYQDRIRNLYDGPAGAVLALGSVLSLHEPLVGRMIRKGRFDVTRFRSILDLGAGAGQILRHLIKVAPEGTQIVACDLSHQMLRRARKRVK